LEACAAVIASELGWDPRKTAAEIESMEEIYRRRS